MGFVTAIFALHAGEYILAPASLGIVLGLMLGPVATRLENKGLRPGLSASLVVVLFIIAVCLFAAAVAAPLSSGCPACPSYGPTCSCNCRSSRRRWTR